MSESILRFKTPKSCSVCNFEKGHCVLYDDFKCLALRGAMLKVHSEFMEERHPQCPLQDTTELLEALEVVTWAKDANIATEYTKLYKALGGKQ